MRPRKYQLSRRDSRLARIERKCDAILSILSRKAIDDELDCVIEKMHRQARLMEQQAREEAIAVRNMYSSAKVRR